jgi:cathepsin B
MVRNTNTKFIDHVDLKNIPVRHHEIVTSSQQRFDGRKVWGHLLSPIIDQGQCGSCWAVSCAQVLSDRISIIMRSRVTLSWMKLLKCEMGGQEMILEPDELTEDELIKLDKEVEDKLACHGNTLEDAWRYLFIIGIPTEQCFPSHTQEKKTCTELAGKFGDMCADKLEPQRYYRTLYYYRLKGIRQIETDLIVSGPITAAMRTYQSFFDFHATENSIYEPYHNEDSIGAHAVRIVGFGPSYWICAGSFSDKWGAMGGYFKILKGTCEIEDNCLSGLADLFTDIDQGLAAYGLDRSNLIPEYLEDRLYNETLSSTREGLDPDTGYVRFFYDEFPNLREPDHKGDLFRIQQATRQRPTYKQNSTSRAFIIVLVIILGFLLVLLYLNKTKLYTI